MEVEEGRRGWRGRVVGGIAVRWEGWDAVKIDSVATVRERRDQTDG